MMPQSMSQGRSQSAHSPELQQQQQMQESSEVQEPQVAQSSTMLQRVRNSQKRQERMQWTQQSVEEQPESGEGERAPGGGMLSHVWVEILPWELMEGMGRGAGSQALLPGSPSMPRDIASCLRHARTPGEPSAGGHEVTPLSTRPAEGCQ